MIKPNPDACMTKTASTSKLASGVLIYLIEELGDARLRCAQLKKCIKEATDLVEKSDHRDHFFEVAGHLIQGVPDLLMRLDNALNASAMAASRLDYEEVKNGLKPEKAEELENVLQDVRMRYLNRRSNEESVMPLATSKIARLMSRQEAILKDYVGSGGKAMVFDDLPPNIQTALSRVKDQETLWSDVDRWLSDNNNPHTRPMWATQKAAMNAKTAAYYLNKLAYLTATEGRVPTAALKTLIAKLEGQDRTASELTPKAASAFRNIAAEITKAQNPSRVKLAATLRRIMADTMEVGAPQEGCEGGCAPQESTAARQQQAGAGTEFQKHNPGISDEEAKVIDEMHDENKENFKS